MNYSIIICTYNRADILRHCFESLVVNLPNAKQLDLIIVVDNNSSDNTKELSVEFQKSLPIYYFLEPNIGLSKSRNTAIKISSSEILVFLDDDCYLSQNFFQELENTILKYNFDAFTGNYLPWYKQDKPKWISKDFGSKDIKAKKVMEIEDPDFFTGGIMAFKKDVLIDVGLFPTSLGMRGNKISYGEETFVEEKLRANNYKLGINPKWVIHHLVRPEKLTLRWHFVHKYAQARDDYRIRGKENLLRLILKPFYVLVIKFIPSTRDLFFKKEYYWQNYLLDLGEYFAYNAGRIVGRIFYTKLP